MAGSVMTRRRIGVHADHEHYKWWALSVTSLGMLMFPREQLGLALGTNTMVAAIGLVIGPVLGGALVSISWHWVFWFNVPLGLAGSVWAWLVLRELAKPDEVRGLDLLGTSVFVVGLTGL